MDLKVNFLEEMANFTFISKYARYNEKAKRRETWEETISRVEKMHLDKFKNLSEEDKNEIKWAFNLVRDKKVSPSMRSLQFGGKAIQAHELRNFNCSVLHVDSIRSFSMAFYTLLCGTGVGYGLNKRYLSRLPDLVDEKSRTGTVITYVCEDNIEGWADSIEALMLCYFKNTAYSGRSIVFDYSKIRRKGTKLKTGGGKAPGYKGLKNAHQKIKKLLSEIIEEKKQKRLKTIDAFDALMHLADATLSGGIRRSACDVVFDEDDQEMMKSKTGEWFKENPQRARANISIGLLRKNLTLEKIQQCIQYSKEFGEPGFTFIDHEDSLFNPCQPAEAEILTKDGLRQFKDLNIDDEIWSETGWTKIINKWATGIKSVYKYRTSAGWFLGTENHKIIQNGVKIEVKDADFIDILKGKSWNLDWIDPQDVMDGLVIGDGSVHIASNNKVYLLIGEDDQDYFKSQIKDLIIKQNKISDKGYGYDVKTTIQADELPKTYERFIPERFLRNPSKARGFLKGLYSANGSIVSGRVTFKTASSKMRDDLQLLLSSLGIESYYTTNKSTKVQFSNGIYNCKESYDININKDKQFFYNCIGFLQEYKKEKLEKALEDWKPSNRKKISYEIKEKIYIGEQEVFDITVDNEPHTYWTAGCNVSNCFEIGFIPVTEDGRTGVQMCNLTSINGAKVKSLEDFKLAAKAAAIIGTLQASYTSFPYLGATSEELTKNEALLGVSITGILDNPDILTNPEYQQECAKIAVQTNKIWAKKIGINQAARVTCVKPEGSNSIVMMAASGIHPHHARKYFRRIQCNKEDNIYNFFKLYNPDATEESVWSANKTDDVIIFPITISDTAMVKKDLDALKHLEIIKSTQKNWVVPGTTEANKIPVSHAVSCTVIVQPNEWDLVAEYLYKNNQYFSAVSLLAASGDKDYKQAPMEEVKTKEDEEKFNKLIESYQKVDYSKLEELDDDTHLQQELACAGGRCEII